MPLIEFDSPRIFLYRFIIERETRNSLARKKVHGHGQYLRLKTIYDTID
jgi:hypothetical protein